MMIKVIMKMSRKRLFDFIDDQLTLSFFLLGY